MTIPGLHALLVRLASNAEEQGRYRDAAEIKDGMKALDLASEGVKIAMREATYVEVEKLRAIFGDS
jgi:hypothetical protein